MARVPQFESGIRVRSLAAAFQQSPADRGVLRALGDAGAALANPKDPARGRGNIIIGPVSFDVASPRQNAGSASGSAEAATRLIRAPGELRLSPRGSMLRGLAPVVQVVKGLTNSKELFRPSPNCQTR
jgi:hypothetical protein